MRIKKIVPLFTIFVLAITVIILYVILLSHDLSLQSVQPYPVNSQGIYLISYADGAEIYMQNQNAMNESAINKGFDFIFNYHKHHLDPDFVQKNADIFANNTGAGLWIWKPWIILRTLEQMPEDAILFYGDSNTIFKRPIHDLVEISKHHEIILLEHPNLSREQEAQLTTLEKLDCNSAECRKGPSVVACFMILRNTAKTRSFIQEWLDSCEDRTIFLRDDRESPNLERHIYDQAVLGPLSYKHRNDIKLLKYTFIRDNYIATAYRKVGLNQYNTQDAEIFRYSLLGRLEYKLSNTWPLIKLRELLLTNIKHFPWRNTYLEQANLEDELITPH